MLRLPVDSHTPFGFAIYMTMQSVSLMLISHVVVCGLGLFFGFFGIMMAFGQSIQKKIHIMNTNFIQNANKNRSKITKELCEVVRFHSDIKEFSIVRFEILLKILDVKQLVFQI